MTGADYLELCGRVSNAKRRARGTPVHVVMRPDIFAGIIAAHEGSAREWGRVIDGLPCIQRHGLVDEFEVDVLPEGDA